MSIYEYKFRSRCILYYYCQLLSITYYYCKASSALSGLIADANPVQVTNRRQTLGILYM
jgi:hypothetical protein